MDFFNISTCQEKELIPGYFARFVHTDYITIAYWRIVKNMNMPEHSHPNEQTINMIEGEFELQVENATFTLKKGDIFIVPPNIPHSGKALSDCRIIDVFYPFRSDYKNK